MPNISTSPDLGDDPDGDLYDDGYTRATPHDVIANALPPIGQTGRYRHAIASDVLARLKRAGYTITDCQATK